MMGSSCAQTKGEENEPNSKLDISRTTTKITLFSMMMDKPQEATMMMKSAFFQKY
jgi:hypothetical protein